MAIPAHCPSPASGADAAVRQRACRQRGTLARALLAAGFALGLALAAAPAAAALLEGVLSPGDLIQGHAKAEADCDNCHNPFKKTGQDELCEKCHKDILKDIDRKGGYHGRIKDRGQCRSCHTDHKGRAAQVVILDEKKFNHDETDYALKDSHTKVECAKCHLPKAKHRDVLKTCNGCHKKDDDAKGHKGSLGDKCQDCHTIKKWKDTFFDHDKTKFPLKNSHADAKVQCKDCHANNHFKNTPLNCFACHKKDDDSKNGHHGRYGQKCETCHTDKDRKTLKFDHDRDTKYALLGKHRTTKCNDCHTGNNLYKDKAPTTCIGCHKKDDKHKGSEGDKCEDCHVEQDWKTTKTKFDHDLTRFPLLGLHNVVSCAQCHRTQAFTATGTRCLDCHKKDDVHKGGLGPNCDSCHTPNGWALWSFDHLKQTGFALTGAHGRISCADCHRRPAGEVKLAKECVACHQQDDIHAGQFGRQCERCHTTVTFRGGRAR